MTMLGKKNSQVSDSQELTSNEKSVSNDEDDLPF